MESSIQSSEVDNRSSNAITISNHTFNNHNSQRTGLNNAFADDDDDDDDELQETSKDDVIAQYFRCRWAERDQFKE